MFEQDEVIQDELPFHQPTESPLLYPSFDFDLDTPIYHSVPSLIDQAHLKFQEDYLTKSNNEKSFKTLNPEFETTVYRYPSSQDASLHDHKRSQAILTLRLFQNSFIYRHFLNQSPTIAIIPEEDVKFGNILQFKNRTMLMHIKLRQEKTQSGKKFFYIEPQEPAPHQIQNFHGTRNETIVWKCVQIQGQSSTSGEILKKNDEIRFGLQTFRVIELELQPQQQRNGRKCFYKEYPTYGHVVSQGTCKICLNDQNLKENPLVNLCRCKGSCQFLHYKCLKIWLDSNKIQQHGELLDSYIWDKFQCQICKTNYPLRFKHKEEIFNLVEFPEPSCPYMILERIRGNSRKKFYVIKGTENASIKIGRCNEADIQIIMNSVSRQHALIEFKSGKFVLEDLDSTFGTLVRVRDRLRVEGKLKIQVGDMMIRFDLVYKKNGKEFVWKFN